MQKIENYLTEKEVSGATKFSIQTLRNHRHESKGIPFLKINRSVRYLPRDVQTYMEQCRVEPEGN
jgi:hypothetical protein